MKQILTKIIEFKLRILTKIYRKLNHDFNPRTWSNKELRKISHNFSGKIINVSAGLDKDKENAYYRNYFSSANEYYISNYEKTKSNVENEIILNLEDLHIDEKLHNKFDVVFTHTVLEHVYNVDVAVKNLCKLSNDIIITVVPFIQPFHHEFGKYSDYWRFSPHTLVRKFKEQSYQTIYLSWNKPVLGYIYVLHICTKNPDKWEHISNIEELKNMKGPGAEFLKLYSNYRNNKNILLGDISL